MGTWGRGWEITFELWHGTGAPVTEPNLMCSKWAKWMGEVKFEKTGGVAMVIYATNRVLKTGQTRRGQPQDLKPAMKLQREPETSKSLCEKQTINLFCNAKGTPGNRGRRRAQDTLGAEGQTISCSLGKKIYVPKTIGRCKALELGGKQTRLAQREWWKWSNILRFLFN